MLRSHSHRYPSLQTPTPLKFLADASGETTRNIKSTQQNYRNYKTTKLRYRPLLVIFIIIHCTLIFAFSFLFLISSQFLLEFCLLSLSRSNCVYCSFYHCIVSIYSAVKLLVCFNKLTVTVTVTARFSRLLRHPACKRSGIIMVEWEGME